MECQGRVEASFRSNYNLVIDNIWSSLEDLAARLQKNNFELRKADQQAFDRLIAETRSHLLDGHSCIDWRRIAGTDAIPTLRNAAGLPSLNLGLGGWVVVFSAIALFFASIASLLVGVVVGAVSVFGIATWLKSYRLKSLLPKIKIRLMHYAGRDDQSDLPFKYESLLIDESSLGLSPLICEARFSNISQLGIDNALGLFANNGNPIGFVPICDNAGILNVIGYPELNLGSCFLTSNIEHYTNKQKELVDQLFEIQSRLLNPPTNVNLQACRAKWRDIVVPPNTMEHILRAWLLFSYSDRSSSKGILLKGPPGTGKSLIASIFSETSGAHFFKLTVGALKGSHIGESGKNAQQLWEDARNNQPAIIFIDECEGIFVKRGSDQGDSFTNELVQTFLSEWDGIGKESRVLVIGATNRPELIDDAVTSRFTDIIDLPPIENEYRAYLIEAVARQIGIKSEIPAAAIDQMGGLSGRDLRNVLQQAIRLAAPDEPRQIHFENAIERTRGKGSTKTDRQANWNSLVLSEETKQRLKTLCHMVKDAEALVAKGIPVTRTLLLYGPPGTGKTQIARTVANEAGVTFIARTTADFKGQYLGQASSRVAQTFETARSQSPCILFIDEIDALTSSRQSGGEDQLQKEALIQLLQELDGVIEKNGFVLVIAATNQLDQIDSAILSRFSQKIEIGLPDTAQRIELLRVLLANRPVAEDVDVENIAKRCNNYSGRDLRELITEAFNAAVERTLYCGLSASETHLQLVDIEKILKKNGHCNNLVNSTRQKHEQLLS